MKPLRNSGRERVDAPRVAILVETSKSFGRSLLLGIARYSRAAGPWSMFFDEFGPDSKLPRWLKAWEGDGVIMRARNRDMVDAIVRLGTPVVDTLQQVPNLDVSGVYTDDEAIGRAAAEHLLSLRLKHFAFVGVERANWSLRRRQSFIETLHEHGTTCHVYSPISRRRFAESWEGGQNDLAHWLKDLPKPVGLFASHDMRAMCVFDACRRGEIAIPEQVAVVGVDDDDVICRMSDPPLTSIPHQGERIGYEAARLLDRLMSGAERKLQRLLVAPKSIAVRRSTDTMAVEDATLALAMKTVRNCGGAITVPELAQKASLTRRALERRFAEQLAMSPHELIAQERLRRVKELLTDTDFSLSDIAQQTKLSSAASLSSFFKGLTGETPGEFRRQARQPDAGGGFFPKSEDASK